MRYILILAFILISESVLTGLLPHSRGFLFDILESKLGPVWVAIGIYFCNYFFLDFFQAIKEYFVIKTSLMYRTARTRRTVLQLNSRVTNLPQRVQEDIKLSYLSRITVWCEYFISGTILVQLIILNLEEPMLVGAALIYAVVSVLIAFLFNPRLNFAEKSSQQAEATFRTSLVENLMDLSFMQPANSAVAKAGLIRMQYKLFTKLQLGVLNVLPYVVLVPALFAGDITLGTVVKHQATFALIVVNASILIHYYTMWVQGKASEERVQEATLYD